MGKNDISEKHAVKGEEPSHYFLVSDKALQHLCAWAIIHGEFMGATSRAYDEMRHSITGQENLAGFLQAYAECKKVIVSESLARKILNGGN
jgi:hypothetical protein